MYLAPAYVLLTPGLHGCSMPYMLHKVCWVWSHLVFISVFDLTPWPWSRLSRIFERQMDHLNIPVINILVWIWTEVCRLLWKGSSSPTVLKAFWALMLYTLTLNVHNQARLNSYVYIGNYCTISLLCFIANITERSKTKWQGTTISTTNSILTTNILLSSWLKDVEQ